MPANLPQNGCSASLECNVLHELMLPAFLHLRGVWESSVALLVL
jgi:hypothetical protein